MSKRCNPILMFTIACLFAFMHALMMSIPITMSPYFEHLLKLDSATVLNLYSIYFISCIIMQIPVGILFAKYGLRMIMLVSVLIATIGFILHMLSSSSSMLLASRLVTGAGCATAYLAGIHVAINFFDNKYLVLLIGVIETISTFGSMVAANPLYALLYNYGWGVANIVIIKLFILIFLLTWFFVYVDAKINASVKIVKNNFLIEFKKIISNKSVRLLVTYAFLNWFIMMSFAGYWIRDYMINIHNYSVSKALMLSNIYWSSFLIGNLVIGYFANSLIRIKRLALFLSKLGVGMFLFMVIPIVFSHTLIIIFCILAGISGVAVILAFALVPHVTNSTYEKDVTTSIVNMAIMGGGVIGQYLFGFLIYHIKVKQTYFDNSLFSNNYYLALWIYVFAAVFALWLISKLSKQLIKVN